MPQTTHTDLLHQAKQNQADQLRQSAAYSKQLANSVQALIKSNSTNGKNTSSLLDKITTIHQLNDEIDKQLNHDIAINFDSLLKSKKKLRTLIDECYAILGGNRDDKTNLLDKLQSRSELIDQDLRILEHTLKLVKNNK
ncbi:uncharacterized protein RJT20DRAFT_152176 [Scheffersomyces xylosifermentans]|uniref:uncharacterized protein n=1 Tax=Scheffersomyces xylosifermentans TaxID=1304137 RepID=UPI00315D483E